MTASEEKSRLTVGKLLDDLGFPRHIDHDEAVRWALIELYLRRRNESFFFSHQGLASGDVEISGPVRL